MYRTLAYGFGEKVDSNISNFVANSLGKLIIASYYIKPSSTMLRDDLIADISVDSNFIRTFYNNDVRFTANIKRINLDIGSQSTLTVSDYVSGLIIGIIS